MMPAAGKHIAQGSDGLRLIFFLTRFRRDLGTEWMRTKEGKDKKEREKEKKRKE
jgi:hypothetical protein